ncbi:nitrate- and nitrite sensing domain-containing protein, partial [Streptomyces oceani]
MSTNLPPDSGSAPRRRRLLTVRVRLVLVAAVSILGLLGFVLFDAQDDWEQQTNLRNDSATGELGGEASLPLFTSAQTERTLTGAYLADPNRKAKARLDEQRARTDQGIASFKRLSGTELETDQRHKWQYVERVYDALDQLKENRRAVDERSTGIDQATGYYTGLLADMVEFYQALSAMDDPELTVESRALVGLFWASEGLSQENALIAQAGAAGRMSAEHRRQFAEAYGSQRVMYERWIAPYLPEKDKALYQRIVRGDAWRTVQRVERAVLNAPTVEQDGSIEQLPGELKLWQDAYVKVAKQFGQLNLSRTQGLLANGYARADEVREAVYWKVGLSIAAVIGLAVLIIGILRSVTNRLRMLRSSAEEAGERLPAVVHRLRSGERIDTDTEFPTPTERGDEFTGLALALNNAQRTAVRMATAQAEDRNGFARFVATTSSRTLNLIEVQLGRLTELERKYGEDSRNAGVLRDLITVDHPGVAARRHLDNLQTLAGGHEEPYTEPKSLADLIHDARSETDEPERVDNKIKANVWVRPEAVNAVMHVVAALLDNALSFSHGSQVAVTSVSPVHGVAVEIEDMGTGMTEEEYAEANEALSEPPTFEAMAKNQDGRLGLFVVGHLARLYDLRVRLRMSDYGGTKAIVMLPHGVQCPEPEPRHGVGARVRPTGPTGAVPSGADAVRAEEPHAGPHADGPL